MQIPSQELMTQDGVTIHVDAVAFYRVEDPLKALCNVENWDTAVREAAQVYILYLYFIAFFLSTFEDPNN